MVALVALSKLLGLGFLGYAFGDVLMGKAPLCSSTQSCKNHDWKLVNSQDTYNVPLVFAVKQANLDVLESKLLAVSDPASPSRGDYLSAQEVRTLTSDMEAASIVKQFVDRNGAKIDPASTDGFIRVVATKEVAEQMLGARFEKYYSESKKATIYRTLAYHLPTDVANAVDYVSGTVNFPSTDKHAAQISFSRLRTTKENTAQSNTVTPALLSTYFNIDSHECKSELSSNSVFASLREAFSPTDLADFQARNALNDEPISHIIGPNNSTQCATGYNDCEEASLDVQYIKAVARNVDTTFWSVPNCDTCVNEPFVDWLVAVEADDSAPLVHSVSYGDEEYSVSTPEMIRFNVEAMKMGARGLSLIISSGDDGVGGDEIRTDPSLCGFHPNYPASSPYVTTVGATQGPESGMEQVACQSNLGGIVTSGGGFSGTFSMPAYQQEAVAGYLTSGLPSLPPQTEFSAGGRAYPDVSALGFNYEVVINGGVKLVSGTSASTPAMAGVVTLLNDALLSEGKPPMGFLNPTLYSLARTTPAVFNDVTSGSNNCSAGHDVSKLVCCKEAFEATEGWDPVTGLGSVNFEELKKAVLASWP